MRLRMGVLGFLVAVLSTVVVQVPAASARSGAPDWVLLPRPGGRAVTISGAGRLTGPLVVGIGYSTRSADFVLTWRVGGDGLSVRLGAVGLDVRLSDGARRFSIEERTSSGFDTDALLFFAANAEFDRLDVFDATWEHPYSGRVISGRGSTAMAVADPKGARDAVSAGPLGAGTPATTARTSMGIVGAFDIMCVACHGSWTAPIGRRGAFSSAQLYANDAFLFAAAAGTSGFSGPAGTWDWQWQGATVNDPYAAYWYGPQAITASPVTGAWAPIGDHWKLFDNLTPQGVSVLSTFAPVPRANVCPTYLALENATWDAGTPMPTLSC